MKTADLVQDYLRAVEREASALPAERRQELLGDLAEHIEVTRAERPGTAVVVVLAELGDPRAIAATALAEAAHGDSWVPADSHGDDAPSAKPGRVHPLVPLLMLTLVIPFGMVFPDQPGPAFSFLFRVAGAVLLCTSVHWRAVQKTTGVLLTAVLPTVVIATWNLSSGILEEDSVGPALLPNLVITALIAAACTWLWRIRRA